MLLSIIRAVALAFVGFSIFGFPTAHATPTLYKKACNGCHSGPPTCNGCHIHAVHKSIDDGSTLNLVATTDKQEYAAGEDITVTLSGSDASGTDTGWIRVKLYDDQGVELGQSTTEFPARMTTRAYSGATHLYMSWVGFDYDQAGAIYGAPIGTTFGTGMRLSFVAGVHHDQYHIEEVVQTNTFSVRDTAEASSAAVAAEGENATASGGGALDLAWLLGMGMFAAMRRWVRKPI